MRARGAPSSPTIKEVIQTLNVIQHEETIFEKKNTRTYTSGTFFRRAVVLPVIRIPLFLVAVATERFFFLLLLFDLGVRLRHDGARLGVCEMRFAALFVKHTDIVSVCVLYKLQDIYKTKTDE